MSIRKRASKWEEAQALDGPMLLGEQVKHWRTTRKVSQEGLMVALGHRPATGAGSVVSRWENGKKGMVAETLHAVAWALNVHFAVHPGVLIRLERTGDVPAPTIPRDPSRVAKMGLTIGEQIVEWRKEFGLNQTEFGLMIGLGDGPQARSAVSTHENGHKSPQEQTLYRIAYAFGAPLDIGPREPGAEGIDVPADERAAALLKEGFPPEDAASIAGMSLREVRKLV